LALYFCHEHDEHLNQFLSGAEAVVPVLLLLPLPVATEDI
jgi:hypothetical protein